jgi:hypothetical protein
VNRNASPTPLGAALATLLGLRPTLWIAGAGVLLSSAWLLLSPLRSVRELPRPAD